WDQGTESGAPAPAAPIADTSVAAAASLTSHPPLEVDGGRGRGTPQPTATARERLRSLVARFMGRPAWLEPARRGTEATQTVPDRPHEGLAPRRDQSPPQTLSSPPTAGRKPREGAALAVQAETIVQPEATVTAKPPHTAAVQTRTVASERASATWHAQTYAPQPKSEHEAADVGVDPAPATPLPPKHARTARALSQPVASHSHAPHPRSEHETAGVGVDRAPATPLRPERASAALAPTRPIAYRSSARNAPRSRPQVLGHFPDSPDSPSSQHRIPLEPTAARMSFAMPMSSDAVEFAAAVWPDLPPLPWADQERHSSRQSWHEFVRLERLDAEQRG
ncbi:MAG: hypothetical protein OEM00_11915, partial [Burkholderiaceae bacterium]|nr:hypothetical protein [Burkholderiaceae bacterium]